MSLAPGGSGFGRALSRVVAWGTVPLFLAGIVSKLWLVSHIRAPGLSPFENVSLLFGFGAFAAVGSLLVGKQPRNPVGWIMASIGLIVGVFPSLESYAAYVMTTRGQPDALAVLGAWLNAWYWYLLLALVFVYLPLLFPDGRLPSRPWLPVAVIAGLGAAGMVLLGAVSDPLIGQDVDYRIHNPIGIAGMPPVEQSPYFPLLGLLFLVGLLGATASMVVRFRRTRGVERQQLKWFLYVVALLPLFPVIDSFPVAGNIMFALILAALPAAIGIAVLRYRLYDIDLIIRRTLIYTLLTAALALVYFGSVAVLQSLITAVGGRQSSVVIVASTLAIAALFSPLRRRVQDFIDRRFYRRKYDAAHTLAEFAAAARDETDLDRLAKRLVGVVEETVQPERVSLWLASQPAAELGGKSSRAS